MRVVSDRNQHRSRAAGRRVRQASVVLVACLGMLASTAVGPAAADENVQQRSAMRIGVLALADAIAAVGRTPELAEPMPFTRTSAADVLQLDDVVTQSLLDALAGNDLETALTQVPGIVDPVVDEDGTRFSFGYERQVTVPLELAHDDGDLRFGTNEGAEDLAVRLATPQNGERFVVEVDPDQPEVLLQFALVSEPELELSIAVADDDIAPFPARQGFTDIEVTGGSYTIDRRADITLRDPNGRGLLTLEDLKFSTLPDLFRIERTTDEVDIAFDVALPDDVAVTGGADADRRGSLTLSNAPRPAAATTPVWPQAADAARSYGDALDMLTHLSRADGMTALAEYTGATLALQDAADVGFPNLAGGLADLFAPGDELLDMLSTSAVADIRCGLTPANPPAGVAAPGDTVYCDAVTAEGLAEVVSARWSTSSGTIETTGPAQTDAVGSSSKGPRGPRGTVRIDGSDGEPDVSVEITLKDGTTLTARTMPRTVQDVVTRVQELAEPDARAGGASATVNLAEDRVDVAVSLRAERARAELSIGNPATLGALVGLTGLENADSTATAEASGATFDVGFGIPDARTDPDRSTVLLPRDNTLIEVDDLSATAPSDLTGLSGRIGFLDVSVDVDDVTLGRRGDAPVVALTRPDNEPIELSDLLTDQGTLASGALGLVSRLEAGVAFSATELPLPAGSFASGGQGAASGSAEVTWGTDGLPRVGFSEGYDDLRVFDPVPATFLTGTAAVTHDSDQVTDLADPTRTVSVDSDTVKVSVPGSDLFTALGAPHEDGVQVTRRLVAPGVSCLNVTVEDAHTLTCEGLAPDGTAAFADGDTVDLIVLGDPFALRDGIIEGLTGSLNAFERLAGDNRPRDGFHDDQYTSTLPLVDLTPAQLAEERTTLADGLAGLTDAATEDESGTRGSLLPVSSAQQLSTAVKSLVDAHSTLGYTLGAGELGVALTTAPPAGTLKAPLRFFVGGTGQVVSDKPVSVDVDSQTTLAIDVDVTTARPSIADSTGTTSRASLDTDVPTGTLRAGVGQFTLRQGSSALLDVTVTTTYVGGRQQLETARTTTAPVDDNGNAASADLAIADRDDNLRYSARATDSSGGTGAVQPGPEAMQVKFLAEGLDGLAAAVDSALDGAAPRNTPDGVPVSAPLIGSDLDAGADVSGVLKDLTSALRDRLGESAVADAATADQLETALEAATDAALDSQDAVTGTGVSAAVTCTDECAPCEDDAGDAGDAGDAPEAPCASDGPTAWDTVSVSATLQGVEKQDGETPFSVGLAGLNVRSDQMVSTTTSWTLPITLELVRGQGPRVTIDEGDALALKVDAELPAAADVDASVLGPAVTDETCTKARCLPAIVGYLPAMLTTDDAGGSVDLTVNVAPEAGSYDLFDLYDGKLQATPSFAAGDSAETGLELDFETVASDFGSFDLVGQINVPWSPEGGFDPVTYKDVKLDVGEVIATLATPFAVADPYLGPARDVIDVLRTPIPVVSDLSELAGGSSISLLSLLDSMSGADARLELASRIITFIDTASSITEAIAPYANKDVPLAELAKSGELLRIDPAEVALLDSCTQTVSTRTTTSATPKTTKAACPSPDDANQKRSGARGQTAGEQRRGVRGTRTSVARSTRSITGSAPGFSIPFLEDPDQLVDVLTGEGEASYFRLDFGSLVAEVAYTQSFGPIMAGPVPIKPFVGGSIRVEGRMAVGFDSMAQTLAVRSLSHPGDVAGLVEAYGAFDGGDILREGFYLDDLDAEGVDVPEVKLVTTLEAGAGVSIGIVTAGLKGGVTLTINLDLNDPNDDGRIRTAEIRDVFAGNKECIFDASATIEAFIQLFFEINLLFTTQTYDIDLLRLGPYKLFEYGCADLVPTLVVWDAGKQQLALTSGTRSDQRGLPAFTDIAEDYEVRQFDTGGGAGTAGGSTMFEVSALNRVQRVEVKPAGDDFLVTVYEVAVAASTTVRETKTVDDLSGLGFLADGGTKDDRLSFLPGETYEGGELVATSFSTPVTVHGNEGSDLLVTGEADDTIGGGPGGDSISAGLGDDLVDGAAGDDIVDGGAGMDDLVGGPGADRLEGGPGPDRAVGAEGNDVLVGGPGRDVRAVLLAGVEDSVATQVELGFDSGDALVGGPGDDTVDGGDGSDIAVGGDASEITGRPLAAQFGPGERTVNVLARGGTNPAPQLVPIRTVTVPGPAELDTLCASGAPQAGGVGGDLVTGGPEDDVVVGSDRPDDLDGGSGSDEICARAGDDHLSGDGAAPEDGPGPSNDVIRGGQGNDRVEAGPGEDLAFGDDVDLFRAGVRVLDGTLGRHARGTGADYLDGGDGDDTLSGGSGSDLVIGGTGDDTTSGEGRDTRPVEGADGPGVEGRLVACDLTTRVVGGYVDLDGDLLAGPTSLSDVTVDDGRLAGLEVRAGVIMTLGSDTAFTGLVTGDTVVIDGRVDLDRDGAIGGGDTGTIALASMLAATADNADGDCILSNAGDDQLRGGTGSDYLGAGAGTDLLDGGDGDDLMLGDPGTDVLLGGAHHDVLVGGADDDHLLGGPGDDRLRGNDGDDDLVAGNDTSGVIDGQDVLLGGRGEDVLAGENAALVSAAIVTAVAGAPWGMEPVVPASVRAGEGSALRFADSALACGVDEEPVRWLTLRAGGGEDRVPLSSPGGSLAYDELFGGFGCDWVFGQDGDDLVRGGQGDDVVEAGTGTDTAYGDAGNDVVVGGSSVDTGTDRPVTVGRSGAGVADGPDRIFGDGGPDGELGDDLLLGDNATPIRIPGTKAAYSTQTSGIVAETPARFAVQLADVQPDGNPTDDTAFGDDVIFGGGGDAAGDAAVSVGDDADRLFGQGGDDRLEGGAADDYLEGGTGQDTIGGGAGDDDAVGGSSAHDGLPLGPTSQRLGEEIDDLVDDTAAGLVDGVDNIDGGAGEDVVLGDNGRITRPGAALSSATSDQAVRDVAMADETAGATSGSDHLSGGDGDDTVYGQLDDAVAGTPGSGDRLEGGAGTDAVIGDLGVVELTPADQLGDEAGLELFHGVVGEAVYVPGTLVPVTRVPEGLAEVGGSDTAYGGDDDDVLRLGAAADLANGGAGDDVVFGGADDDALWGGPDHDRLFGGYGADDLDLKPRESDPASYFEVAGDEDTDDDPATVNGADLVYGGWGPDEMQADQGGAGPQPGSDHLVDWVGIHNVYYVCDGPYGAGRILRQSSPAVMSALTELVVAAGGTDVDRTGSAGWLDLGLVENRDKRSNSTPSPEAPGNFTCEG
ncbi:MAG TPA: hypothetical protein VFG63_12470 [Nocardioidaceae bacterium]|nr:hypothetical protein [Nocardioidaceae bacterium]